MNERRRLYTRSELQPLLSPTSIAVVDFSSKAGSFGARTARNLAASEVPVYLVNPKQAALSSARAYATVDDLPGVVDCAIIAVPRDAVCEVVEACARRGIRGAIVYASGFAETGDPRHRLLQDRLTRIAREMGIRVLGPNCIGILSEGGRLRMTFADTPDIRQPRPPAIGLVSQSGGLGLALAQGARHGFAYAHVLTAGNSCDVDVADQIAYLAEDPDCKVIACLFEGIDDPLRLLEAARLAARAGKPVIVQKLATGEEGMHAAMSHTGSLVGSASTYRAAFSGAGIIEVEDFEAIAETASFFAKAGRPRAYGVAALSTTGGGAIMVADKAELHSVPLPQPSGSVAEVLRANIPEFGSARNPCDVTAQILANPQSLPECARALLADDMYGALVIPHPYAYTPGTERLLALEAPGRETGKPICCVWLSQWLDGPGAVEVEGSPHLALFRSMDRCMATLRAWHVHDQRLRRLNAESPRLSDPHAGRVLTGLMRENKVLTEQDAKQALAAYGIPVVPELRATSPEGAVQAADQLGYPVVLKILSPEIAHKTEAGGVRLDLRDAAAVEEAFHAVVDSARGYAPAARIDGVLVQPMLRREVELIVGGRHVAAFGPTIMVGLGGVFVELLKDSVVALAPVSTAGAREMLDALRGRALLNGFRGGKPADVDQIAAIVARASEFLADHPNAIDELDINPLVISDGKAVAVDALITLGQATFGTHADTGSARPGAP